MDDESLDEQFAKAVLAYKKKDARFLSQFVIAHDLTAEQRKFVAKALCGDIEQADGRTIKPTTEAIISAFDRLRIEHFIWDMVTEGQHKSNVSKIASIIAEQLGYDDVDSVRRTINRMRARREAAPKEMKRVLAEMGHEKK